MSKENKYQNILYLIIVGVILICYVSYKLAIAKTLEIYQVVKQQSYLLESEDRMSNQMLRANVELEQLNNYEILRLDQKDLLKEKLLHDVKDVAEIHNVSLSEIPNSESYDRGNQVVILNKIHLKGEYMDLVCFLFDLEKQMKYTRVVSTEFLAKKNISLRKKELILSIYVQNNFKKD